MLVSHFYHTGRPNVFMCKLSFLLRAKMTGTDFIAARTYVKINMHYSSFKSEMWR